MMKERTFGLTRKQFIDRGLALAAIVATVYVEHEFRPFRRTFDSASQAIDDGRYGRSESYFGQELSLSELLTQLNGEVSSGASVDVFPKFAQALAVQGISLLGQDIGVARRRGSRLVFDQLTHAGEVRRNYLGEPDIFLNNGLKIPTSSGNSEDILAQWVEALDVETHESVHASPVVVIGNEVEDYGILGKFVHTDDSRYGFSLSGQYQGGYDLLRIPKAPNFLEELSAEVGRVRLMRQFYQQGAVFISGTDTVMGSHLKCRCHAFLEPALNWVYSYTLASGQTLSDFMLERHLGSQRKEFLLGLGMSMASELGVQLSEGHLRAMALTQLNLKISEGLGINMQIEVTPSDLAQEMKLRDIASVLKSNLDNRFQ